MHIMIARCLSHTTHICMLYACNHTVGSSNLFHMLSLYMGMMVPYIETLWFTGLKLQSHFAGRVVGSVVGSLVLVTVIVTVISIYLFFTWRRKQKVKELQMDIFARYVSCLYSQNCGLHDCPFFLKTWEYSERSRVRDVQYGNTIS